MLKLNRLLVLTVVLGSVAFGALGCVEQAPGDEMDVADVAAVEEEARVRCKYDDPDTQWVGTDAALCSQILWGCDAGWAPFTNSCGCGCFLDCNNATYHYFGTTKKACAQPNWLCGAGEAPFNDNTGCGCVFPPECS